VTGQRPALGDDGFVARIRGREIDVPRARLESLRPAFERLPLDATGHRQVAAPERQAEIGSELLGEAWPDVLAAGLTVDELADLVATAWLELYGAESGVH
jgi:hypothetical protein